MRPGSATGKVLILSRGRCSRGLAVLAGLLLWPAPATVLAQSPPPTAAPQQPLPAAAPVSPQPPPTAAAGGGGQKAEAKLGPDQLEALTAPIALYPDPLLSQALMASTYPLEIIQAQQWLGKNAKLKGEELDKGVKSQNWDPSVQATAMIPDLLKRLAEDITWTTNLGNAFLAQQADVMAAVQRLRKKAKDAGKLESNDKMKVETKVVETEQVVVIEPTSTQVVYVPAYNPTVIWGPPVYYPYPPVYYPPPPPPGAMLFSFGVGMMMGAAMHGGYCCGCGWGHSSTVVINNNNNFVNHYNRTNNVATGGGQSNWQHNGQHRGGAPYGDRATATKYGGGTRGGGAPGGAGASTMDRGGPGASGMDRGGASAANRGGPGASGMDRGGAGPSSMDRGGGGAQAGNRSVSPSAGGSAFGGAGGGANRAQASSSRGASSMGARPSGGSRGGGGGGSRGGGGRR